MNDVVHKIFYSWQDDRPNAVCRGFIERALQGAVSNIAARFGVDEAE